MVRNPNLRRILERLRHLMESIEYIFITNVWNRLLYRNRSMMLHRIRAVNCK